MASSKDSVNVEILFVDGVLDDHVKLVESRFMLFRIDNRIRVRRLVVEAMNEDCTLVMWLTEAVMCMHGVGLSYGKNLLVHSGSDVTGAVYRRVLEEHWISYGRA